MCVAGSKHCCVAGKKSVHRKLKLRLYLLDLTKDAILDVLLCVCVCCQLSASEPIELSLIYPTPPSVENNEGDKYDEIKMSGVEGNEHYIPNLMWDMVRLSWAGLRSVGGEEQATKGWPS